MDITLVKTFLEVANTGSFVSASERLFVTQSAISLRVQRLEQSLGHSLFQRSKAGAALTAEGRQFEPFALSLLKIWEDARQQIAVPDGYDRALSIGAQYSLWPRLGFRWMDTMQSRMPDLSVHCEVGMSDRIMRFLVEGVVQAALLYTPQMRPGLTVEPALADELVLVASWPGATPDLGEAYVAVDWGPEFNHALSLSLPELAPAGRSMALGALAIDYLINLKAAAFVPARAAKRHLDAGRLHIVEDAPRFPYPSYVIMRDDLPDDLAAMARSSLADVVHEAERDQAKVIEELDEMGGEKPSL
ncbi:MAG: LysR family transcriptional regulator [Pseudomonadota bacterium]